MKKQKPLFLSSGNFHSEGRECPASFFWHLLFRRKQKNKVYRKAELSLAPSALLPRPAGVRPAHTGQRPHFPKSTVLTEPGTADHTLLNYSSTILTA